MPDDPQPAATTPLPRTQGEGCRFEPAPTNPSEDKVRKDLVQVFFGLVLTQMAVYASALIQIRDQWQHAEYWAAWSHLILAFFLTTTSWFGWQMAMRGAKTDEEASIFQGNFVLSLLDILLVTIYFLLVHQIELVNVNAFPNENVPKLRGLSAAPESLAIALVFTTYFIWDCVSKVVESKPYAPWPSGLCIALTVIAIVFTLRPPTPYLVIALDIYLLGVILAFRSLKRWQKWHAHQKKEGASSSFWLAPPSVRNWIWACVLLIAISLLSCLILM